MVGRSIGLSFFLSFFVFLSFSLPFFISLSVFLLDACMQRPLSIFSTSRRSVAEGAASLDTTAPTLSTTLLSTTLKRGAGGDAMEFSTTDLSAELIKVQHFISSRSETALCVVVLGRKQPRGAPF